MKTRLIALSGPPRSGKTTLRKELQRLGYRPVFFKAPIVHDMRLLGFTDAEIEAKSPEVRRLMQAIGPAQLAKNPNYILTSMAAQLEMQPLMVCDDLRREEELHFLRNWARACNANLLLVRMERPDFDLSKEPGAGHALETALDNVPDGTWNFKMRLASGFEEWNFVAQDLVQMLAINDPLDTVH